jgi:hypothetical protein
MKTAAIFAALVMLASSENISRADDYWSGYVDLSHLHERVTGEDGAGHFSDRINLNTLGGAIQYRLDNCAVGLKISGSSHHYSFTSSSEASTTIGAEAGCRVKNLWIVGLGRFTSFDEADPTTEYKDGAYGIGLYYIFNDQYRLGFAAEQQKNSLSTSDFSFNDQWMTYAIKSKYFVSDDLMLSSSLEFDQFDTGKTYSISSKIEYKLKDRPISFYAGFAAGWSQSDDIDSSIKSLDATVGLRFFFNDGSLKTIVNNSIPDFGD